MKVSTRVLVIEDSPVDGQLLFRKIKTMGWEPSWARDLGEAEDLVREAGPGGFDLVLVDLTLPDAEGLQAIEFVRSNLPDAACVVSTAEESIEVAEQAMTVGATEYLVKGELKSIRSVQRVLTYALNTKRLLRQFEQSELNVRNVLSASTDAIVVVDDERRVLWSNKGARPFLAGLTTDGKGLTLDFEVRPGEELDLNVVRADTPGKVPLSLKGRPISWAGGAVGVFIKDRSLEEELAGLRRRALRLRRDWHDVKNLARIIQESAGSLLSDGRQVPLDAKVVEGIVGMGRAIVSRSTPYVWQQEQVRTRNDVNGLVRRCQALFSHSIDHRGAALRLRLQPDLPLVMGIEAELEGILDNLIQNALRAIEKREAPNHELAIDTRSLADSVEIRVRDTGCGIPAGKKLSDLLHRARTADDKAKMDAGVGLAGVVRTVEELGGQITFDSKLGEGTTFLIVLPAAEVVEPVRGRRVLVLEDQDDVARGIRRSLEGAYEVTVVPHGAAALKVLAEDADFDAVITDMTMPEMDGRAFFEVVCRRHPALVARLCFCTGGAATDEDAAFLRDSGRPILPKPFKHADGVAMIEQLAATGELGGTGALELAPV